MRLSVQLYTLRDDLQNDVRGTLAQVRDAGFEYVELAGLYGKSASDWKRILDELALQASGAHMGFDAFEDRTRALGEIKELGFKYAIIPWLAPDARGNWEALGQKLDRLGAELSSDGIQLAYHNHDFELEDGGLDKIFENSSETNLRAELDLAWVKIGGADPVAWIRKMGGRVPLVHLKDYDPAVEPQWVPAGRGVMDWDSILQACREVGVEYGVVELDAFAGEPIEAVRESYRYFADKGLK